MIKHHLSDTLLMGYSAGTLSEAFNLIIAAHISMCDDCRAAVDAYDSIGGVVLAETEDAVSEMSSNALRAVLARLSDDTEIAPQPTTDFDIPAPLVDYIGGGLDDVKWRNVGMGVRQAVLKTSKDATARLLYIPAGAAVPDHGHRGTELTLVLKGAFSDEQDRFAAGDIEIADEDLDHQPIADIGEACICLAVTDAPLKFSGLLLRLAQPFLKI